MMAGETIPVFGVIFDPDRQPLKASTDRILEFEFLLGRNREDFFTVKE
jgi:hypothetical protein